MVSEVLVSRLLARLDEIEKKALSEGHRDPDEGGFYACPATRSKPYGDLPWGEDACDCGLAGRRESVLRLCRAHRDIVDEYQQAIQAELDAHTEGLPVERVIQRAAEAQGLYFAVVTVARGLGVEEVPDA